MRVLAHGPVITGNCKSHCTNHPHLIEEVPWPCNRWRLWTFRNLFIWVLDKTFEEIYSVFINIMKKIIKIPVWVFFLKQQQTYRALLVKCWGICLQLVRKKTLSYISLSLFPLISPKISTRWGRDVLRQRLTSNRNVEGTAGCRERSKGESGFVCQTFVCSLIHQVSTEFLNCVRQSGCRAERCPPIFTEWTGQWERQLN